MNENLESLTVLVNEAFQESNLVDAVYELGGYGVSAENILKTCKKEWSGLILEKLKQIVEFDAYQEMQEKYNARRVGFSEFARAYALKAFNEECIPSSAEGRAEFYQELFNSLRSVKVRRKECRLQFAAEEI